MDLERKLSIFEKIKLWWKFEGKYYGYDLINGIKNIFKWLPIIWKDRDYDYSYIYDVLAFKLKKQATYIGKRNLNSSSKRGSEKMLLCVKLINKIKNGDYSLEYGDYHKTKFEFLPIENSEYFTLDTTELEENFQDFFNKYPLIYKKVIKSNKYIFPNDSKLHIAMNISQENENRAKRILFKILENNIEQWWD